MKKMFTLALSLALCCGMFAFAACKKDDPAPQSSGSSAPVSEVSSEDISSPVLSESSASSEVSSDELSSTVAE